MVRSISLLFAMLVIQGPSFPENDKTQQDDQDPFKMATPWVRPLYEIEQPDLDDYVLTGLRTYNPPPKKADALQVGNARNTSIDVETLMKGVNFIEADNLAHYKKLKAGGFKDNDRFKEGCIDSLLVAKNDQLILEEYFADAAAETPHYQMSITKGLTSCAIGLLIRDKLIAHESDLFLEHFPGIDSSALAEDADKITIADLLSMRSGIRFQGPMRFRFVHYDIPHEGFVEAMLNPSYLSINRKENRFNYQSSDPQLLSHLVGHKTGKTMEQYLAEEIFLPLGIKKWSFKTAPWGDTLGATGLRLASRDMLKIGILVKNEGRWGDDQIIPADYVNRLVPAAHDGTSGEQFGYNWRMKVANLNGQKITLISAVGMGGQFLYIVPTLDLVVVFNSYGTYKPRNVLYHAILPACLQNGDGR